MITPRALAPVVAFALLASSALAAPQAGPDAGLDGGIEGGLNIRTVPSMIPGADAPGATAPTIAEAPLPSHRVVGSVNGEAFTSADVAHNVAVLIQSAPEMSVEFMEFTARRFLAEEIILAAECRRLGVNLSDYELEEYWERRFGARPDFEVLARQFSTTVARQKELARRAAMSELYMLHKVGLRGDQGHIIPVDPVLQRMVSVTPRQLRELFYERKAAYARPETATVDACLADSESLALAAQNALKEGLEPTNVLVGRQVIPIESLADLFPPELAVWIAESRPGDVSEVFPAGSEGIVDGYLVVSISDRQAARPADFGEIQADLRRTEQMEMIMQARRLMVMRLVRDAVYWPEDLFLPSPGRVASPEPPP
jgi:hypothetical protein